MVNSTIRVLLIEDNPGDERLIREMLLAGQNEQFHIQISKTLKDGLQIIQQRETDIILLDLSLPDSSGLETLMRTRAEAPRTAIVVLTGFDDTELGIQAVQVGAQDYLPKNHVDGKLLVRSIRYAIERQQTEIALRQSQEEYRSLIDDVFDTSTVAVIILDRSFTVVWCNESTEVYFGVEREELLGEDKRKLIDDKLKCIFEHPDVYAQKLLKAYSENSFTEHLECHVVPEGKREERWLLHWSQRIRSGMYEGGRIEQYADITERKKLEMAEQESRLFSEGMRDIATLLTSTLDLNEVLGRILGNLIRIIPHDSAAITILEDGHVRVARQYSDRSNRDTQEIFAERELQVEYKLYLDIMYETQKPVIVADLQEKLENIGEIAMRADVHSYIGAPILLQNQVIGFINVFSVQPNFFIEPHAERLSAFAELAAVAIQNAQLYQQSQELAAIEERQRLARDLHDSVSQTLFTCKNMAESAVRRWNKDPARSKELMDEVLQLTLTALAEMRILLLELRPAALTQIKLKQLFQQYLQPIQDRRQFGLAVEIDDVPTLPPDVQIALYRIAQEALNNIDKHARARNVELKIKNVDGGLELHIQDDGEGFEVDRVSSTSLGLQIMRERANQIGAQLNIESEIGTGTEVSLIWNRS